MNVRQILDKVDDGQLFVPAFQREYVWKRQNAKDLFDSLIKKYPTGTMLTWETRQPPELKGALVYNENMGAVKLILDGQQRITTLYMIMKGKIPPYYTDKDIKNNVMNLYVKIDTLELEYYKSKFMDNNPLWISLTDIYRERIKPKDVRRKLKELELLNDELEDTIDINFDAVKSVESRDFVEQHIPITASIKEAIDIFYIVNASGVNLTDAELALAQISGYWPKARQLFKDKLNDMSERGFVFNLDFIVYVFLGVLYYMGSDLKRLHSPSNEEQIKAAWDRLSVKILDYVMNIMQEHAFIDHTKEINSVYALIPIIVYTYHKEDGILNQDEINRIVKWFYYSQIRQRYISQLQQKLDKDLGIISKSKQPFDELLSIIKLERPLEITPEEFIGVGVSHPLFNLMKFLLKSRKAKCLGTGVGLSKPMGKKYQIEYDHIFAYSILKDAGYNINDRRKYALAQEITNRCLLTQHENRSKSASYAYGYLEKVKEQFPDALELQLIPENEELWVLEKYEDFLKERRRMLSDAMNDFLGQITASEDSEIILGIDDLLEVGETSFLELKTTFHWDSSKNMINEEFRDAILKTIAGFSNSDGGTLLIGVSKDKEIMGLEDDYNTFSENSQEFKENLDSLIQHSYNDEFDTDLISISYPLVNEIEICQIDIKKSDTPAFLKLTDKYGLTNEHFCVRFGNSTDEYQGEKIPTYIRQRFDVFK